MGLAKLGSGTLTLAGSNTYTGTSIISAGTVNLDAVENAGVSGPLGNRSPTIRAPSCWTAAACSTQRLTSGRLTRAGCSTAAGQQYNVDTNGETVPGASPLTSPGGSLTKLGSGMLILEGEHNQNTYTGATYIENGTLRTRNDWLLPAGTTVTLGDAAAGSIGVLDLYGCEQDLAGLSDAGGSGSMVTSSDDRGVLELNINGNDLFSGCPRPATDQAGQRHADLKRREHLLGGYDDQRRNR